MASALLFDLDGTLMDTIDLIVGAMNGALAEDGEPPLRKEDLQPLVGMPVQRQMELLRGQTGPRIEAMTDRYYAHFRRLVDSGLRLYPGVDDTFPLLKGRRIGTMTTRRKAEARHMIGVAGLQQYFSSITGGDEVSRPKPNPDLPLLAAESLGVPPGACVVIGDSPVDILAGRAAGAWTIAAMYGYGVPAFIEEAKPHARIERFADLPMALAGIEALAQSASSKSRP